MRSSPHPPKTIEDRELNYFSIMQTYIDKLLPTLTPPDPCTPSIHEDLQIHAHPQIHTLTLTWNLCSIHKATRETEKSVSRDSSLLDFLW
jgi:hypothetical protein